MADRVAVMYAGRIVEEGPARKVLTAPKHPYTQGLRIARALIRPPKLNVADEQVSALDVSVGAQVLRLLQELPRASSSMSARMPTPGNRWAAVPEIPLPSQV